MCKTWLDSGEVVASLESCLQCVKTYGKRDVRSVRECAFKKEIGQLRDGF